MLQVNVSGAPRVLPTLTPPVEVPPGGEIDHPEPLAGFEPVPAQFEPSEAKPSRAAKKAAAGLDAEEAN